LEEKKRAGRNRTIALTTAEIARYAAKCACLSGGETLGDLRDVVIRGDAFDAIPRLPDACVDLMIADPPYNLNKAYGAAAFRKMDAADYARFTEEWVVLAKPKLKANASLYVCCDWRSSLIVGEILGRHFILRNRITWQREKGRGANRNWKNAMEDIWFATRSDDYAFHVDAVKVRRRVLAPYRVDGKPKDWEETADGNFRDTFPSNFWDDISIPYWSMPENTDHPTQKPEKLIAKLVLAGSRAGDLVFDPFLGSGTTAVVAKKLDRRFVGIEREEEYCALAQKRLELAEENRAIQGYTDGVFWERNTLASQRKQGGRKGGGAL